MKQHYLNLIEFDNFIRSAFRLCCDIMKLNSNSYRIEYNFSNEKRFGLFTFPNKITLYVNTLLCIGENLEANKTFIIHTLFHELIHSTQDITGTDRDNLEITADMIAVKYVEDNRLLIYKRLNFVIDGYVLALFDKPTTSYNYIKASRLYIYTILLNAITWNKYTDIIDEYINRSSDLYLTIVNLKIDTTNKYIIKKSGELIDPSELVMILSGTLYQYYNITYNVSFETNNDRSDIIYKIKDFKLKPIIC